MTNSTATTSAAPAENQTAKAADTAKTATAPQSAARRAPRSVKSASATQKAKVSATAQPVKATAGKKASATPVTEKAKPTKAQGKKPAATPPAKTKPTAPKTKAVKAPKVEKEKKVKVVRDSFTIPKAEFMQLADMKKRAMGLGVEVKKSELIRAGLQLLASQQDTTFKKALSAVPTIKTGRPSKD